MNDKKKIFEHESMQDCKSVIRYLKAITDGFEKGTLRLEGPQGEIALAPNGLIRFEVQASERSDRSRMTLRFTWRPPSEEKGDDGTLLIESDNE